MITLDDVRDAAERLRGVTRTTAAYHAHALSLVAGRPILLKPEHLQRTGSFKIRGAYNHISRLPAPGDGDGDGPATEVVAASAGNHAQGVALAAALTGRRSRIFMPAGASLPKLEATRAYGAAVELCGRTVDEAVEAARAYATRAGAAFVPPFDDPFVVAGQGTVGLELAAEAPDAEVVVVPVGGGGLVSGVAVALRALVPRVRIVGVQAEGAASMLAALDAGRPSPVPRLATMADGIAVQAPSALTLAHVEAYVDDVVTVSEEEISRAVLLLLERAKAVVEPAGAVGLAALVGGRVGGSGPAAVVLSGGNVDPLLLTKLIDHGLSVAGRYLVLRVLLEDRPGTLADLAARVAELGLNVLSVDHHRSGLALGVHEVQVVLTLETRDPGHGHEVVEALRASGLRVELARAQ